MQRLVAASRRGISLALALLLLFTNAALASKRTLTIAGYDSIETILGFESRNSGVVIRQPEGFTDLFEAIRVNAVNQDTAVDIYIVPLLWGNFHRLREKGYCYNLQESSVLSGSVRRMYPQLTGIFASEEGVWAYPLSASGSILCVNEHARMELGISSAELPATFEEFLELAITWNDQYGDNAGGIQFWSYDTSSVNRMFSNLIDLYTLYCDENGVDITFENEQFEMLLSLIDDNRDALQALDQQSPNPFGAEYLFSREDFTNSMSRNLGWMPLELSLYEEGTAYYPLILTVYFINPFSQNIDLAMEYLEYYSKHMDPATQMILCQSYAQPVADPSVEAEIAFYEGECERLKALAEAETGEKAAVQNLLAEAKDTLDWLASRRWLLSEEDIAYYHGIVSKVAVLGKSTGVSLVREQFDPLVMKLIEGAVSVPEFLGKMQEILRMMRLESGT